MPFCKNCGSAVEGQFCAKCGTPIAAAGAPAPPPAQPAQPYGQPGQQQYQQPYGQPGQQQYQQQYQQPYGQPGQQQYAPPAQPYAQPTPAAGGMTDNVAGLLCYVLGFITGILFLVLEPYNKNRFVRFHAFQSIFYNIAMIVLWIVMGIIGRIMFAISWALGGLWGIVGLIVWLGFMVGWIFLLIKAYQGQQWKLPVIGNLAEKQANG